MGTPAREILLGAVFLFPVEHPGAEVNPGAHRDRRGDRRGEPEGWTRWVDVDVRRTPGMTE